MEMVKVGQAGAADLSRERLLRGKFEGQGCRTIAGLYLQWCGVLRSRRLECPGKDS
jgi:hypothetical protein